MPALSRRTFSAWLASLLPAALLARPVAARADAGPSGAPTAGAPPLDERLVAALAAAVLPSELGAAGITRAAADFQRWAAGYRAGAELVHGYGTAAIGKTPADPRPTWTQQLSALDAAARTTHARGFPAIPVADRRAIVRAAIAGERLDRLPSPAAAGHVAVALLAQFYASPGALDLCYERQIAAKQCRPLAAQSREPAPLRGRRA